MNDESMAALTVFYGGPASKMKRENGTIGKENVNMYSDAMTAILYT